MGRWQQKPPEGCPANFGHPHDFDPVSGWCVACATARDPNPAEPNQLRFNLEGLPT